jgi:uncharacterized Zn-binding protein involved in type VI secretion
MVTGEAGVMRATVGTSAAATGDGAIHGTVKAMPWPVNGLVAAREGDGLEIDEETRGGTWSAPTTTVAPVGGLAEALFGGRAGTGALVEGLFPFNFSLGIDFISVAG